MTRKADTRGERGAVLVHVALALFALTAISAFAFDYGVLWVARRQAQNAADAGAHAGAVALAFDSGATNATAEASARAAVADNFVWGAQLDNSAVDVAFSDTVPCPDGTSNQCVRVDVYRGAPDRNGATRGTALPVFFGALAGVSDQNVRATATAEVFSGGGSICLKPWAVIDRWSDNWVWTNKQLSSGEACPSPPCWRSGTDNTVTYTTPSTFDTNAKNSNVPTTSQDTYDQATDGFQFPKDEGQPLTISREGNAFQSGWFQSLDFSSVQGVADALPDCNNSGAACYKAAIEGCIDHLFSPGDELPIDTKNGEMTGPQSQGTYTDTLAKDGISSICQDSTGKGSYWDGSQINGDPGKRLAAIPLVSPADDGFDNGGKTTLTITNIMGFFIRCPQDTANGAPSDPNFPETDTSKIDDKTVEGYLVPISGVPSTSGGGGATGSFIISPALVR